MSKILLSNSEVLQVLNARERPMKPITQQFYDYLKTIEKYK